MLTTITHFSNLCNFHILSLDNYANLFANVPSVVTKKCAIFDNLLHTTNIVY